MATVLGLGGIGYGAYAQTGQTGVQPPRLIAYQGYLEDGGGPIEGQLDVDFFITSERNTPLSADCASSSAPCYWSQERAVTFSRGYFSLVLGEENALPLTLFRDSTVYLRVSIGGETLDGAQRLLAAPFAVTAELAGDLSVDSALSVNNALTVADDLVVHDKITGHKGVLVNTGATTSDLGASTQEGLKITHGGGELEMDGDEISASRELSINAPGGIYLNSTIRGDLHSSVLRVEAERTLAVASPTEETVSTMDLGSADGRMCFLTSIYAHDSADRQNHLLCEVAISGGRWEFRYRGRVGVIDPICKARCLTW